MSLELVFTQMLNSNVLVQLTRENRQEMLATCVGDRPLVVQLCGNDPAVVLEAGRLVHHMCDAIDLNLGCPQNIAKRGHYGAFLMEELDLLHDIVSTLVQGVRVPVTCKTRIYSDLDRSVRLCETLVNAGASMLTIHGRQRDEKGIELSPMSV
jgi:tRNA-dihydrouridine synthase 1